MGYIKENASAFLPGDDDVFEVWAIILLHSIEERNSYLVQTFSESI